ncbi:MAG: TetR/AcrR family transcriptional regulator [Absicoccus sp.]|uniref:TetR/AcrR family transcriptional regulator n=1 Tax=Absicoccus sp. TaxID=2718527 RepID=UPI002A75C1B1|nr:TetR/AcrR family transcriptional regulator [Absicoccus sp.]MDY3035487.1 TetR/AcrR family transcriptional regulator [Absicoccus sp.]
MTTRDRQREETKKRIYDCAFQLFEKKGFDNVKVQDIAKAAGISIGGLYHHYRSKADIIDFGYFAFDEQLEEQYQTQKFKSPREGIEALIRFQMQTCVDTGVEIISITFRNQINAENHYRYSEDRYLTKQLIANLKKAGLDEAKQKQVAEALLRTARGYVYDWCCRKSSFDLVGATLEQVDIILAYYQI